MKCHHRQGNQKTTIKCITLKDAGCELIADRTLRHPSLEHLRGMRLKSSVEQWKSIARGNWYELTGLPVATCPSTLELYYFVRF